MNLVPIALALAATVLVLLAAQGIRMLATTGLESAVAEDPLVRRTRSRGLFGLADTIGARFVTLTRGLYGPARLAALDRLVRSAGRPEGLTPATYIQRHTGFMVLGAVLLVLMLLNRQPLLGVVAGGLFAAWMPLWLRLSARDRRARIERELPDFLDVLAVTVNAGIPFRPALARVRQHHEGPLSDEVKLTLDEMELGVSRRRAFEGLRDRTGSDEVATFVTALLQAEELGVPLADALTDISAEIRRERAQQIKQAAAKAASKVSLVTTMTMVPGSVILILAVLFIRNIGNLGELFG